ncbi:hypothetical protein HME9304_02907 [Flagellimonas maritima]|uniref:HTH araC/xylS-type domain-containing protein n=1 Tax=Flagellimonas maritima TaxID=1383885 RepID=A0A2Z4LX61_9FLAO|nr:AraC family transcriptional regulator [Allomuricauda aurantiaca]AWX45877.1 hypothetical protein HME9304_02907 [Allomuricauda aurantiaca]
MSSFNFVDVIFLIGIAQGLFLGITLPIVHQKNTSANIILSLQLIFACLMLLMRMIIYKAEEIWIIRYICIVETFIFMYGPLGYMYLKRLLEKNQQNYTLGWVHYIPALLYFSFLLVIANYTDKEYISRLSSGKFYIPFLVAETAALILNIYYWYLCGRLFLSYQKNQKHQLSFSQRAISFVKIVLFVIGSILFLWVLGFISKYFLNYNIDIISYNIIWIGIPILIYVVGYYALRQPEIFRISTNKDKPNAVKFKLEDEEIIHLKQNLEVLMDKEKVYLDNELTLVELSKRLNTSTNNLSWLLNNIYKKSFYNYINQQRVSAFLRKIKNREHLSKTLFSLSLEVGFNSKSTFNKAFREVVDDTPSGYIKKHAIK